MGERVIFKNTPLGDYLEDVKQADDVETKIKTIFQSYYTSHIRRRSRKGRYISSEVKYFTYKSYTLLVKVYSLFSVNKGTMIRQKMMKIGLSEYIPFGD